jgi:ankyrin repeat protein
MFKRLFVPLLLLSSSLLLIFCSQREVDELIGHVRANSVDAVKKILESSSEYLNVKANDGSGQTPLMTGVLSGSTEVVKFLLTMNPDVTIGEKDGYTPFHGAGFQGRAEIASLLLEHGLDPLDMHKDGYSPLHRAAWGREKRHTDFVRVLLKHGVNPELKSVDGKTALVMTKNEGTKKVLQEYVMRKKARHKKKKDKQKKEKSPLR